MKYKHQPTMLLFIPILPIEDCQVIQANAGPAGKLLILINEEICLLSLVTLSLQKENNNKPSLRSRLGMEKRILAGAEKF